MAHSSSPGQPHRSAETPSPRRCQLLHNECRVVQWRKEQTQSIQHEAARGVEELRKERDAIEALQQDLITVKELTEEAAALRAEGARFSEAVRQSVEAVVRETEVVEAARDRLSASSLVASEEILAENKRRLKAQEESGRRQTECEQLLSMYRSKLGLTVTRAAPQTVRLAFRFLDEADPNREFSVTLGMSCEGYRVSASSDPLPQLEDLLESLNKDAGSSLAMPRFLCSLRRAFKEISAAQAAGA